MLILHLMQGTKCIRQTDALDGGRNIGHVDTEIDDVSIDFNQNCFFKKNKKYTVLGRSQGPISSVLSIYKKWRKGGKEGSFFFIFLLLRFFIYFFLFKSYEGPDELTSYLIFFFSVFFFLSFVSFFFFVSFLIVIFHSAKNRFSRI